MRNIADQKVKTPFYGSESLDSLPLPVILISSNCILLAANKRAREVFNGFRAGEPLSNMITDSYFLEACARVFEKNEAMECEIVRTIRRKRTFQASISPFQSNEGDGAYIAIYETTAAREAERMRASFVADVSHELRSPLTTLIATIETLRGRAGANPDTRARFIELMAQETERMHGIVDDLLSLSATEAVEHILPNQTANLLPIMTNIAKVLSTKARAKGMDIVLEIEDDLPDMRGEYDELYQAIYNLAENAIKYGESDSNVTLRVDVTEHSMEIKVHNYGTPIQEKHIPRLTERFYRVDKSRSRDLGGTGLGLAIVKHIINRHLGELNITSSEEGGTTFSVTFQVMSEEN
ncbi:ATP-binding protein [Paremcibacter congregatus]|uniref:sensor histidine kinase n=1 Tax=Paremcibacter congregatus TaxID=2043170 RepID=UPI003A8E4CE2